MRCTAESPCSRVGRGAPSRALRSSPWAVGRPSPRRRTASAPRPSSLPPCCCRPVRTHPEAGPTREGAARRQAPVRGAAARGCQPTVGDNMSAAYCFFAAGRCSCCPSIQILMTSLRASVSPRHDPANAPLTACRHNQGRNSSRCSSCSLHYSCSGFERVRPCLSELWT